MMKICLSEEFAQTIGDLTKLNYTVESGVSIRNKYILYSILKRLSERGIEYQLTELHKKFSLFKLSSLYMLPLFMFKGVNMFEPCSYVCLEKIGKSVELNVDIKECDIIILHHGFSLLKYHHAISNIKKGKRPLVLLEMPDNIIETVAYSASKRYCIKLLERVLQNDANIVDIITSPTLRDSLYYINVLKVLRTFTIYNIYNVFSNVFTDDNILSKKKSYALCISTGSWYNESIYKFVEEIASLMNKYELEIKEIHILGAKSFYTLHIGNVRIYYWHKLPLNEYYEILSRCVITVLFPRVSWSGGHSVRLNDAALMGNVILGSDYDLRGEPYEYQYTYLDARDLIVKLLELLRDKDKLIKWGMRNREIALERGKRNEHTFDILIDAIVKSIGIE